MAHVNRVIVKGVPRRLWQEVQCPWNLLDQHKARQCTASAFGNSLHASAGRDVMSPNLLLHAVHSANLDYTSQQHVPTTAVQVLLHVPRIS